MQIGKFFAALGLALFVKIFVLEPFVIPSSSMDTTLVQGDYVLVNKWQNNLFGNWLNVKKGAVLAFHYPLDKGATKNKKVYIKRCAALPGDTLQLLQGKTENEPASVQFDYLISDPNKRIHWDFLKPLGIHLGGRAQNNSWLLCLNTQQLEAIMALDTNLTYAVHTHVANKTDLSIFPSDTSLHWNRDFYGPIYTPKKGATIALNSTNFKTYKKIIADYEQQEIELINGQIYLNGSPANNYTFAQNYYFMLGDNRHHSQDSRAWGFVPEDHLIGTCALLLFNAQTFSVDRLLKKVL